MKRIDNLNPMTRDPRTDPQPASESWVDRSLTALELQSLRERLAKMTQTEPVKFYDAGLHMYRADWGRTSARCIHPAVGSSVAGVGPAA